MQRPSSGPRYLNLQPGDPAPWFERPSATNPRYVFHTAAGRWLVLCFFGSVAEPGYTERLRTIAAAPQLFNDVHASFFGVSNDPEDQGRLGDRLPGMRFLWDFDRTAARLYGAAAEEEPDAAPLRLLWFVLDPTLRVRAVVPFAPDGRDAAEVVRLVEALPPPEQYAGITLQAPVLVLPGVFEPELCRRLIQAYDAAGGELSGVMREHEGRTVLVQDAAHKRRRDHMLQDPALVDATRARVQRRIVPEILKIHQFQVTRMERYLVACYAAEDEAHFRPHRDNTTKGTAHRRFAVSINLNDAFEGGEIHFPEYGARGFKPPPGGAVVFSCSMLHAVSPVTGGRRYAYLPFLYDDAAARLREQNQAFLDAGLGSYQSGAPDLPPGDQGR